MRNTTAMTVGAVDVAGPLHSNPALGRGPVFAGLLLWCAAVTLVLLVLA